MAPRFDLIEFNDDGDPCVTYVSEAELRDALHAFADAYGWRVRSEVPVPGWGRIDLLLEDDLLWVIELKLSITKPAALRRGLTQVHGYAAAYPSYVFRTVLCAPRFPDWAASMAAVAYPDIDLWSVGQLMAYIHMHAPSFGAAEHRLAATEHEAAVRRYAIADMGRGDAGLAEPSEDYAAAAQAMADFLDLAARIGAA